MLDNELAELHGVTTSVLNQSTKRNSDRFPDDFMFQLTKEEFETLKTQIVTSNWGGRRNLPYAFTEQGVAMLSSVLSSDIAIRVNIQIIRLFTKMREMVMSNQSLLLRMEKMERELNSQGQDIDTIFNYLDQFIKQNEKPREKIGFKQRNED